MADMASGRFIVGSVERSIKDVFFSYYSHLVSFAAAILQDGRLAEDIVQDLFVRICSVIREFADEHSLSCFLYTSVKNAAIDELRKRSKCSVTTADELIDSLPDEIANLTELLNLSFNTNAVAGEIPTAVYKLAKLQTLDLSNCKLTGFLSAELGNFEALEYINLLNNSSLEGSIPAEIGKLKALFRVNLSNTSISGSVPAELAGCEILQEFMVFNAKLSGELPDIWDKFHNDFKMLSLYGNADLCCNIPESFAYFSAGVKTFRLQGNKLEGEVPAAVKAHANWNTWKPDQYIFPQQEGYGLR